MTAVRLHREWAGPASGGPAPLVLLGSLASDVRVWAPLLPALTADRRVVRVDLRGHGRSPVVPGDATLDDLAEDVVALLDDEGLHQAHLAGVSLGGMVAMRVALTAPHRVAGLALICTAARVPEPARYAERGTAARAGGMAAVAAATLDRWLDPATTAPALLDTMRAMLLATPPEGYAAACAALARLDLGADLGGIAAPTLVIAGDADPATPPALGRDLAAGIPGARLQVLPGRHLVHLAQPDAVAAALRDHVAATEAAAR